MITKDWEWTMISLAQEIHRSHIIGNQDHQKMKKKKKTLRERERNNIIFIFIFYIQDRISTLA